MKTIDSSKAHEIICEKLIKLKRKYGILNYVWKRMTNEPGTPYNLEEVKALILEWKRKYE